MPLAPVAPVRPLAPDAPSADTALAYMVDGIALASALTEATAPAAPTILAYIVDGGVNLAVISVVSSIAINAIYTNRFASAARWNVWSVAGVMVNSLVPLLSATKVYTMRIPLLMP